MDEQKINLDDDYVKFIRLGQYYVERNGEGILCFITNNTYLDGITFREMRRSLLSCFDDIYILNLHGNTEKKEQTPTGDKDENVFDIQQGVAIGIFVRHAGERPEGFMGRVHHIDLWGKRKDKYAYLESTDFSSVSFSQLQPTEPYYFFVPKNFAFKEEYEQGFKVDELFSLKSVGITTSRNRLNYWDREEELTGMLKDMLSMREEDFRSQYNVGDDTKNWTLTNARIDVGIDIDKNKIEKVLLSPFDEKFIYYTGRCGGLAVRPLYDTMQHMLGGDNLGLVVARQTTLNDWRFVFCTSTLIDRNLIASANSLGAGSLFPLYLYKEELGEGGEVRRVRQPNLNVAIVQGIEERLGEAIEPEELFDYIYSVLHRPEYRERYRELLKIDFPRIPYLTSPEAYHSEAERGHRLRQLHLMQGLPSELKLPHRYPVAGDNSVSKPRYAPPTEGAEGEAGAEGRIYINEQQYFAGVAPEVWSFYIGGYQPAQKWLKDHGRKGYLTGQEVQHYRRILYILAQTHAIMHPA